MPEEKDDQQTPPDETQTDAPGATGDAEFDKAFDQFASDKPEDPDATPPNEGRGEEDPGEGEGAVEADDPDKSGDGKPDDDASGAAAPDADKDKDQDAAPAGDASDKDDEPDIWADAPEPLKAAHKAAQEENERLKHENRSNRGRMSALARRVSEVESARPDASASGGKDDAADQQTSGFLESDEWKALKEELPEVAGPLESVLSALQEQNAQLSRQLAGVTSVQQDHAVSEQEKHVFNAHPDFSEIVAADGFAEWAALQPAYIRDAVVRNGNEIVDGEETVDLIRQYKLSDIYRDTQAQQADKGDGGQPEPSGDDADGADPDTKKLAAKRKRQLESTETIRAKGTGAGKGPPAGDFDAAFKHYASDEYAER